MSAIAYIILCRRLLTADMSPFANIPICRRSPTFAAGNMIFSNDEENNPALTSNAVPRCGKFPACSVPLARM